jgi:hypothetical protein
MKTLSGNAATSADQRLGEEPIAVLRIDWPRSGTRYYASCDFAPAEGRVLSVGDLVAQAKVDGLGSVGAISFSLDDGDGVLKALTNSNRLEGATAYVYHAFASTPLHVDWTLLLKGAVVGPEWSEGDRSLSLEVETKIHDLEVGFAIEQEDYDDLVPDEPMLEPACVGQAWPLCFGSVLHVPALKVIASPETTLNSTFKKGDTSFTVEDASQFPTNTPIDVIIDGMVFTVTVDKVNNRMTVGEANVPKYQSIAFAARESADDDVNNPWVAWIAQDVSIANHFIFFKASNGNTVYHRVIRQEGRKIWLDNKTVRQKSGNNQFFSGFGIIPEFLQAPTVISQVARFGRDGWGVEMSYVGGATTSNGRLAIKDFRNPIQVISEVKWKFPSGEVVRMWGNPAGSGLHPVRYVANLIPSTAVRGVYAWRTNPKTGHRAFRAIPINHYNISLSYSLFGKTPTVIELKQPLSELYGQGWEDTIYVSLKSSVGPNASDIIKWLLENYSNLTVDATTFASVKTKLTKYPMGFARFSKENALSLAESLAWQSRCALIMEDGTVKLKYLSEEPSSDMQLTNALVANRSLVCSNTDAEEIVTQFRAFWQKDYSGRPGKRRTFVLSENVSTYGLRKREYDFFAYNVQSLVQKSASFWAHRVANAWRLAKLNVLKRSALKLEMFDTVDFALSDSSLLGALKGVVEAHSHDFKTTTGLSIWLPSVVGTMTQDSKAWLSDASDTVPADPADRVSEADYDEQWSDDASAGYSSDGIASRPAKIVSKVDDDPFLKGAFYVNCFDEGYYDSDGKENPPTNVENGVVVPLVAYPTDVALALDRVLPPGDAFAGQTIYGMDLEAGTKVSIFNIAGRHWMFNVPADRNVILGKVNGPEPDALGRIGFTHYPNGFDKPASRTEIKAIYVGDVDAAVVGDKVHIFQRGDTQFAVPISESSGSSRVFKITQNSGGGSYTGREYEEPNGVTPGNLFNLKEENGSTVVPVDQWVRGFLSSSLINGEKFYWFSMPFGC